MNGTLRFLWGLPCALLLCSNLLADNKVIKLSSLDWPPYTGHGLVEKGALTAVVSAAFTAAGYQVQIDFFPWERALSLVKNPGSGYAGYFTEYYSAAIEKDFLFSVPLAASPLGLAQNKAAPVLWNTYADLSNYKVGIVQGYVNTAEFDARVSDGSQPVETVSADVQNLKKLVAGRLPLAIIDAHVFDYLLAHEPSLTGAQNQLEMQRKMLENKKLFICFRKDGQGEIYAKAFAAGLKKVDVAAIMAAHLHKQRPTP